MKRVTLKYLKLDSSFLKVALHFYSTLYPGAQHIIDFIKESVKGLKLEAGVE